MTDSHGYIEKEEAWFRQNLPSLLKKYEGKWAVVYQERLLGVFGSLTEAYEKGIDLAKSDKILVRKIEASSGPHEISVNFTLGLIDATPPR